MTPSLEPSVILREAGFQELSTSGDGMRRYLSRCMCVDCRGECDCLGGICSGTACLTLNCGSLKVAGGMWDVSLFLVLQWTSFELGFQLTMSSACFYLWACSYLSGLLVFFMSEGSLCRLAAVEKIFV